MEIWSIPPRIGQTGVISNPRFGVVENFFVTSLEQVKNLIAIKPFLLSAIASVIAYQGWRLLTSGNSQGRKKPAIGKSAKVSDSGLLKRPDLQLGVHRESKTTGSDFLGTAFTLIISTLSAFGITFMLTNSQEVSLALAAVASVVPLRIARQQEMRRKKVIDKAWPQAIDYLISSLHSGRSISESLLDLHQQGPQELREVFLRISSGLRRSENLEEVLHREMLILDSATADQVFTALIIAKEFGGRDVSNTLRLLATFLRDDSQIREEIETRYGWVKNSAFLGASAPWLLLALLSLQPATRDAYATPVGKLVLIFAVIATGVAFIWMDHLARLPSPARPFKPGGAVQSASNLSRSESRNA